MIFDRTENLFRYIGNEDARKIGDFIRSVNADTVKGKHVIDGERLFANVSEYETKERHRAVLEAHNRYLDIHCLVWGEEKQEFYSRSEMIESVPYEAEGDAALYVFPDRQNEIVLRPGFFSLYFTDEAHAPQIAVSHPQTVRKIVVKAAKEIFPQ